MRASRLALGALFLAASVARPVLACCQDAWSCIAAVATGGASCAVEATVNAVKAIQRLIDMTDRLKRRVPEEAGRVTAEAKASIDGAARQLRESMEQARKDVAAASSEARRLARPLKVVDRQKLRGVQGAQHPAKRSNDLRVKASGLPAVPASMPADEASVTQAFQKAADTLDEIYRSTSLEYSSGQRAAQDATNQAAANASRARASATAPLLRELEEIGRLLTGMLTHPLDPLAPLEAAIDAFDAAIASQMNRAADQVVAEPNRTLQGAGGTLNRAQTAAAGANHVVTLMRNLERTRTESDLKALESVVGQPPKLAQASAGAMKQDARLRKNGALFTQALGRIPLDKKRAMVHPQQLRTELKAQWKQVKQVHGASRKAAVIPPSSRQMANREIDRYFRKNDATAVALLHQKARERFARDPKTLAAVDRFIDHQARQRRR